MKEVELAKPVAEWMREQGYTVYAEVPWFSRCIDFVGVKNAEILCIELKTTLSRHVLCQATICQLITEQAYVGIGTQPRKGSIELCKKYGLGILSVKDGQVTRVVEPFVKIKPSAFYAGRMIKKCKLLLPSDAAGKPFQAGCGPAQDCFRRVKEYRAEHPKATWKEIYSNVPNHYCNHSSMAGAMSMVTQRRFLVECRRAKIARGASI